MNKTKRITFIALLSALAIVATLFEIPYPFIPWLKFDLSETVIMYAVTLLGFIPSLFVAGIKTLIMLITGDVTPYNIGEITALISALTFALTFYFTKNLKLITRLIIIVITFTTVMVLFNFFIATPIYFTASINYNNVIHSNIKLELFGKNFVMDDQLSYLKVILIMYVPFNLMKATIISIVYSLTQKPIKLAFELITNK